MAGPGLGRRTTAFEQATERPTMRLTTFSDYSLRMLIYLAVRREGLSTIQGIADSYGVSKNHMMKVAHILGQMGYVETIRGKNGGLRLAMEPEEIRVGAVIRRTEEESALVQCFKTTGELCRIEGACALKGMFAEALQAFLTVLDGYTLADVVKYRAPLGRLLDISPDQLMLEGRA